jgi:hypothetical protein
MTHAQLTACASRHDVERLIILFNHGREARGIDGGVAADKSPRRTGPVDVGLIHGRPSGSLCTVQARNSLSRLRYLREPGADKASGVDVQTARYGCVGVKRAFALKRNIESAMSAGANVKKPDYETVLLAVALGVGWMYMKKREVKDG